MWPKNYGGCPATYSQWPVPGPGLGSSPRMQRHPPGLSWTFQTPVRETPETRPLCGDWQQTSRCRLHNEQQAPMSKLRTSHSSLSRLHSQHKHTCYHVFHVHLFCLHAVPHMGMFFIQGETQCPHFSVSARARQEKGRPSPQGCTPAHVVLVLRSVARSTRPKTLNNQRQPVYWYRTNKVIHRLPFVLF